MSDFGDEKTVVIENEEIIRRRHVAESYLREKEINNAQSDWIETYHTSFSESSTIMTRKAKDDLLENKNGIHATLPSLYPFQNVDYSSLKNSGDSVISYEPSFSEMNSDNNPKDGPKSFKKATDNIFHESFITEENQQSLKGTIDQMCNSNVSKDNSKSNNLETKKPRKRHANSKSKKLENSHTNHEMTISDIDGNTYVYSNSEEHNMCVVYDIIGNKSSLKFKDVNTIKKNDFQFHKFIEIIIMNSKFIPEKYFINSESLTVTEFQRLKKNLARLSFLQKSRNNVYSVNRMNIIDSIGKLTPLNKKDEFIEEKPQPLYKVSHSNDELSIKAIHDKVNIIKKSVTDFKNQVSDKINHKENVAPNRVKHAPFLESTNNGKIISSSKLENTDNNVFSHNSEMLRRKRLVNSYLTILNNNQNNWVETYDFSNLKSEPGENVLPSSINDIFKENKNGFNLEEISEQPKEFSKIYLQERSYIIRWINKLHNKVKDSQCSYCSHNILVSGDNLKILGKLSQKFDIVIFDELVNSIISNATMNNNLANILYFYYENAINAVLFLNYPIVYIIIAILLSYIFIYSQFSNTGRNKNFTLYRTTLILSKHYKWIIFIILLGLSLFWNGNKMYQQKIAEKHTVMSRVVPSYCESILNKESGVMAHFKEYIRHWWHDEDCKKYYEAVMVDPSSEISLFSISTDLFSGAIFQILQPFGRNMNSFFQTLTKELTFIQQIFIPIFTILILIVILCFCFLFLAFRWNYKVYFPFHMGSIEPTKFSVGSRVQEVEEKESTFLKDFSTNCVSQITYNDKTENKNYIEDIILKEHTFITESKHFKLDPSKYCVLKIRTRMRHNSA